jgi:hypothetical protein
MDASTRGEDNRVRLYICCSYNHEHELHSCDDDLIHKQHDANYRNDDDEYECDDIVFCCGWRAVRDGDD